MPVSRYAILPHTARCRASRGGPFSQTRTPWGLQSPVGTGPSLSSDDGTMGPPPGAQGRSLSYLQGQEVQQAVSDTLPPQADTASAPPLQTTESGYLAGCEAHLGGAHQSSARQQVSSDRSRLGHAQAASGTTAAQRGHQRATQAAHTELHLQSSPAGQDGWPSELAGDDAEGGAVSSRNLPSHTAAVHGSVHSTQAWQVPVATFASPVVTSSVLGDGVPSAVATRGAGRQGE